MKWRPIQTAPKDGTRILLLSTHGVREGKYSPNYEGEEDPWKYHRYPSDGCGCCGHLNDEPTHWLPQPAKQVDTK